MSIPSLIKITDFRKNYPTTEIAVQEIIISNRITLLLGENGSGKSTLFRGITGLLKYDGLIEVNCSLSYMPEVVKYPQDITVNQFLTTLSLLENNPHDFLPLVMEFELIDKLEDKLSTLSKGMNGKLNLIQCLMANKDLYILDEPLNGLDYDSVKKLISFIEKSDRAFLISSHIEDAFAELSKEVISLS